MEYRPLDITVISAEGIKNVNIFIKMNVYVVVSITGDYKIKEKTHISKRGGTNPQWSHRIKLTLPESAIANQSLLFQLISTSALGDREIGLVTIPIRQLIYSLASSNLGSRKEQTVDYQVRGMHGKPKGSLKFSYKFGEKISEWLDTNNEKLDEAKSIIAYYADMAYKSHKTGYEYQQGQVGGYCHPPHDPGYCGYPTCGYSYGGYPPYGYPLAPSYGYAPLTIGYACPLVQQEDQKSTKNKINNGGKLGLGWGAGLIGGLLVGEMITNVGEMISNVGEMAAYGAT